MSLAVYAYNTSCHESTGFTPYEMVFGRQARTPLEVDLSIPLRNACSQSEYTQSVRDALRSITQTAQLNLDRSREKQKASHVSSFSSDNWSPFTPGDSVWLRRPKKWKFGRQWLGPYEIVSRRGVTYSGEAAWNRLVVPAHAHCVKGCGYRVNKQNISDDTPFLLRLLFLNANVTDFEL